MELVVAKSILGIKKVEDLTENELKKIYRAMIKKVHPDAGGSESSASDVTVAYSVIMDAIKKGIEEDRVVKNTQTQQSFSGRDVSDLYREVKRRQGKQQKKVYSVTFGEYVKCLLDNNVELNVGQSKEWVSLKDLVDNSAYISDNIKIEVESLEMKYTIEKNVQVKVGENLVTLDVPIDLEKEFKELGIEKCTQIKLRLWLVDAEYNIETKLNRMAEKVLIQDKLTVGLRIER